MLRDMASAFTPYSAANTTRRDVVQYAGAILNFRTAYGDQVKVLRLETDVQA
jgi:hypothetical protein